MTNEEAIKWFETTIKICHSQGEALDAMKTAIKALEEKETREQYEKWEAIEEEEAREYFERRKQPRWIPCSERLPEDKQQILISLTWDNNIREVRQGDRDYIDYWRHFNHITSIAWMPLPEPYRGKEEET